MEPRGQRRVAAELLQPLERPDEGFLSEIGSQVGIASHSVHQPIDPIDMRVVQRTLGGGVAGDTSGYELSVQKAGVFRHGSRCCWVVRNNPLAPVGPRMVG